MAHAAEHDYQILPPSPWPFLGALSGAVFLAGLVLWFHDVTPWLAAVGFLGIVYVMYSWWSDLVAEAQAGQHTPVVRISLRMGFFLFILSEVMFFSAWFWNYFNHALFPLTGEWPPEGVVPFDPWGLPFINTLILLLSGVTVTYAHHSLIENNRKGLVWGLAATIVLGLMFTAFQAWEYSEAQFPFSGNIYGASFFMATGFHGFHVIVGTIFLAVCLVRALKGHFTPDEHVGFEAAVWYWHFVDVVWLFLFSGIYIWGS